MNKLAQLAIERGDLHEALRRTEQLKRVAIESDNVQMWSSLHQDSTLLREWINAQHHVGAMAAVSQGRATGRNRLHNWQAWLLANRDRIVFWATVVLSPIGVYFAVAHLPS